MVARGWGAEEERKLGVTANGPAVSLGSDENVPELDSADGHIAL